MWPGPALQIPATVGVHNSFDVGLILTAFGFGFRHGIDWDHIAALTDITSSQEEPRRSMWCATLYVLGHGLVVFLAGLAAVVSARRLPTGVDAFMGRVVGATLIILGWYVFYGFARHGRDFRMRSRWMLMFSGVRRGVRWLRAREQAASELVAIDHDHGHAPTGPHEARRPGHRQARHDVVLVGAAAGSAALPDRRHRHSHVVPVPDDPFASYAPHTAFGIGMLHGVGAETPTQVLVFLAAAGADGKGTGLVLLVAFLVGLLSSNSAVACAGIFGFLGAARNVRLYVAAWCITALFSLVIGSTLLLGGAAVLPAIPGGQ